MSFLVAAVLLSHASNLTEFRRRRFHVLCLRHFNRVRHRLTWRRSSGARQTESSVWRVLPLLRLSKRAGNSHFTSPVRSKILGEKRTRQFEPLTLLLVDGLGVDPGRFFLGL